MVPVSSCRAAEATKLLENIFRGVKLALVNELKIVYGAMGIDYLGSDRGGKNKALWVHAVLSRSWIRWAWYPDRSFLLDPFYLTWKAREYGMSTRFIELAGEVNASMPDWVIHRLIDALNDAGKPLRGSKVLLVGLAYKANVDDDRESPGYVLLDKMKEKGCQVRYYDPYIPVIRPSRNHAHWGGTRCVGWDRETISEFDAVLIATAHQNVNYDQLGQWAKLIVDTRNAMQGRESLGTVVKA